MSQKIITTKEYQEFISELKKSIVQTRHIAVRKINSELINLYYQIGKAIYTKQKESTWGDNFISQVEQDLKESFPDMSGFSRANLFYMKKFYVFFGEKEKIPQAVVQIPWGHIRLILDKIKDLTEAEFYVYKTVKNSWSRAVLEHQIELNLYQRQGKLQSNFTQTIPSEDLFSVQESFKESYIFDFLGLSVKAKEKDIEKALIEHISRFLLEFGRGFAFVGRQYKVVVGEEEFFIDLLFYNYILKRFVVIELKITDFKPEYVGQIGFYMTTIDRQVKTETDKETIGLIICKSKNKTVVEYALANSDRPTGVAEYKLKELPPEIAEVLPDEEILNNFKF
jgi:predicted nuclease of restriction endonuclease-like (RecB) superfamily